MGRKDKFIKKFCVQTAVYWGNPIKDGEGGFTFDDPVEIDVRWDEKREVITDARSGETFGKQIISKAEILLTVDLDQQGYLYLGALDDFDSLVDTGNPKSITNAWEIRLKIKQPFVKSTTDFVRTVWI